MSKIILKESAVPSTPATGKAALTVTSTKALRLTDDQGVSREYAPSVFGQQFAEASKNTTETNGTSTPSVYLALLHEETVGAKYRIGATVCWGMSDDKQNIIIELYNNGILLGRLELEAKDTGSDIRNWNTSFFYVVGLVGGTNNLEIRYNPEDDDDTATMYYAGLEVWRVE